MRIGLTTSRRVYHAIASPLRATHSCFLSFLGTLGRVERLQKILSRAGIASRRAAEQLMLEGRVSVNGEAVRALGSKADPTRDDIRVDGRRLKPRETLRYLLLNKPRGYITTRSDPQHRPTVLDLLSGVREYVYPVGRLDFDSEGLLLLTNDGDLAARLTHPRHEVPRIYDVLVLGTPDDHDLDRLRRGVVIGGGRTSPARIERLGVQDDRSLLRITVHEGRNRQVRRMCEAIGHPVDRLRRVAIGPIRDSHLKPGAWRPLTPSEVERLKAAADRGPEAGGARGAGRAGGTGGGRGTGRTRKAPQH
jgi:23S rRNA pseudouridine2605 synthase